MAEFAMTLGWTIVYVEAPDEVAAWYERVFGMPVQFAVGEYAQLDTGTTKLGFASYALGEQNCPGGVRRAALEGEPPNVELALGHEDVDGAFQHALDAGEDVNANTTVETYGQFPSFNGISGTVPPGAVAPLDATARPTTNVRAPRAMVNREDAVARGTKGLDTTGSRPMRSAGHRLSAG